MCEIKTIKILFFLLQVKKDKKKKNGNVEFRDSWNLMPTPLAGMVPMFGLDVEDKPFFPHLVRNMPNKIKSAIFLGK